MVFKILAVFVILICVCVTAEESNECVDTSSIEVSSEEDDTSPEVLNETGVASSKNESSLVDRTQQNIVDVVNLTLSTTEATVDEAEEKLNAWVKNYNCTNSATSLVKCVTSVRNLKGPYSWRSNTREVGIPTEFPSDVTHDVSDANWPHKIRNGLEEWFSNLNRIMSKSKELIKKSKSEKES